MGIFYSESAGGFFDEAIHGPRLIDLPQSAREIKAGKRPRQGPNPDCQIPADAVEVSAEQHATLLQSQSSDSVIGVRNGKPVMVERIQDSAEVQALRRRKRDRKLASSDWTQLPDSPLLDETRAEWAVYRQALRDLDMDGADWPVPPTADPLGDTY